MRSSTPAVNSALRALVPSLSTQEQEFLDVSTRNGPGFVELFVQLITERREQEVATKIPLPVRPTLTLPSFRPENAAERNVVAHVRGWMHHEATCPMCVIDSENTRAYTRGRQDGYIAGVGVSAHVRFGV